MTCLGFRSRKKKTRAESKASTVLDGLHLGNEDITRDPSMGPPSTSFSVAQRSPGWYTLVNGRNKDRSSSTKKNKRGGQQITGDASPYNFRRRSSSMSSDSSDSDDSSAEYSTDSDDERSLFSYRKRLPNNRRGMIDGSRQHRLSTSSSERRARRREKRRRKKEKRRRRSDDTESTMSGRIVKARGKSFMARLPSFGDKSGVWVFLTGDQLKKATKQRSNEKDRSEARPQERSPARGVERSQPRRAKYSKPRGVERSRPRPTEHSGDPTRPPLEFVRNTRLESEYSQPEDEKPYVPQRKVSPTRSPEASGKLPPIPKRTPGVQGTPRYKAPPGPPPSRAKPRQGKPSSPRQAKLSSPRQQKPSTPKWKQPAGPPPNKFTPGSPPKIAPRSAQRSTS